jgi:hypothetical protein
LSTAETSPVQIAIGSPAATSGIGDTWVSTIASDGALYSPANDTDASPWGTTIPSNPHCTIAFSRIAGTDPSSLRVELINSMDDYQAQDRCQELENNIGGMVTVGVDGRTWKSSGCASIDGTIYWVIARHAYGEHSDDPDLRQTAIDATIIKSDDFGRTWSGPAAYSTEYPMFAGSAFATPYFIDYGEGKGRVDRADEYVYAVSNNGFWDNGDTYILGRVRRDRIGELQATDWEFLAEDDGIADGSWSATVSDATPIIARPGKLGSTGVTYLPDRGRYVMIGWHYPAGGGKKADASHETVWTFFEAPHPWGPWTEFGEKRWSPEGYYCPAVCSRFQTENRFVVLTAGDFRNLDYYRLTAVPVELSSPV